MIPALMKNMGAYVTQAIAFAPAAYTSGAGNDGDPVAGTTFDRNSYVSQLLSAKLVLSASATLSASETLKLEAKIEDSANGSDWDDYQTLEDATLSETGALVKGFDVQLSGARRYIRVNLTATLSKGSDDTAVVAGVFVFGGATELPIVASS